MFSLTFSMAAIHDLGNGYQKHPRGVLKYYYLFFLQISLFVSLKTQDFVYLEMLLLSFRLFKVNIYIMTKVGTENLIACVSKQDFLQS